MDPVLRDPVAPDDSDNVGPLPVAETDVSDSCVDEQRLVVRSRVYLDRGSNAVEIVLPASFQRRSEPYVEPPVRIAAVVAERDDPAFGQQHEIEIAVAVQVALFYGFDVAGQFRQQGRLFLEPAVPQVSDQPESGAFRDRRPGQDQVDEPVVVEVDRPYNGGIKAFAGPARYRGCVLPGESYAAFVPEQPASIDSGSRHEQVQRAVVVEIGGRDHMRLAPPDVAEPVRPVQPPALPYISVEPVRSIFKQRDHVHGAVPVEVSPGECLAGRRDGIAFRRTDGNTACRLFETRGGRGFFKQSALRMTVEPERPHVGRQDVQVAVVVEIHSRNGYR